MNEQAQAKFPILKHFKFDHLPAHLQLVSIGFAGLDIQMAERCIEKNGDPAETACGLRKLMEAKDCAVRAMLS
jgi:hypothetical protein